MRLLKEVDWKILFKDKYSECCVCSEASPIAYQHELRSAEILAKNGYHVLFAPKAMFRRAEKKFDVFLIKDHLLFKADLKNIISKNPDTIANRISEGASQADRLVLMIESDIKKVKLIDGLRSGMYKAGSLKEIFLYYRGKFIRLNTDLVNNKNIYKLL
jgi:hypothetical protein